MSDETTTASVGLALATLQGVSIRLARLYGEPDPDPVRLRALEVELVDVGLAYGRAALTHVGAQLGADRDELCGGARVTPPEGCDVTGHRWVSERVVGGEYQRARFICSGCGAERQPGGILPRPTVPR